MSWREEGLDILIKNCQIVTMNETDKIIEKGQLGIYEGDIVFVEKTGDSEKNLKADTVIDGEGKIVFPGLVNTHSHFFQSLLKGLGADLPLIDWVGSVLVPYGKKITPEMNYYAAKLVALEALRTGCTTITDFVYNHYYSQMCDASIQALDDMNMRGVVIRGFFTRSKEYGLPSTHTEEIETVFDDVDRMLNDYQDKKDMIKIWMGPGEIRGIGAEELEATAGFCNNRNIPYAMHLLESKVDNRYVNNSHQLSAVELLAEKGFLSPELMAVNCARLVPEDILFLAEYGVNVVYSAVSNMYLGSGIAPVLKLRDAGINISLGTEGALSNNTQDMLETMKISSLLQKLDHEDPGVISAKNILRMATVNGANGLHWQENIGSLEPGKKADLFIFNPDNLRTFPMHDPVSSLVYSAGENG
ncbi:MAG: amidohydrolase family protein, partial [Halanaerobiaceae bacterium]